MQQELLTDILLISCNKFLYCAQVCQGRITANFFIKMSSEVHILQKKKKSAYFFILHISIIQAQISDTQSNQMHGKIHPDMSFNLLDNDKESSTHCHLCHPSIVVI